MASDIPIIISSDRCSREVSDVNCRSCFGRSFARDIQDKGGLDVLRVPSPLAKKRSSTFSFVLLCQTMSAHSLHPTNVAVLP